MINLEILPSQSINDFATLLIKYPQVL